MFNEIVKQILINILSNDNINNVTELELAINEEAEHNIIKLEKSQHQFIFDTCKKFI